MEIKEVSSLKKDAVNRKEIWIQPTKHRLHMRDSAHFYAIRYLDTRRYVVNFKKNISKKILLFFLLILELFLRIISTIKAELSEIRMNYDFVYLYYGFLNAMVKNA